MGGVQHGLAVRAEDDVLCGGGLHCAWRRGGGGAAQCRGGTKRRTQGGSAAAPCSTHAARPAPAGRHNTPVHTHRRVQPMGGHWVVSSRATGSRARKIKPKAVGWPLRAPAAPAFRGPPQPASAARCFKRVVSAGLDSAELQCKLNLEAMCNLDAVQSGFTLYSMPRLIYLLDDVNSAISWPSSNTALCKTSLQKGQDHLQAQATRCLFSYKSSCLVYNSCRALPGMEQALCPNRNR